MTEFSIFIVLGTALAFWGGPLPDPLWFSFLPVLLLLIWLIPGYRYLTLLAAAFLWSSLHFQWQLDRNLAEEFDSETILATGVIADLVETRRDSVRFIFKPKTIQNYHKSLPETIRLSWYRSQLKPEVGEQWQLMVKLRKPWGFQNPGGFDFQRWLYVERIGATGYVKRSKENRKMAEPVWWDVNQYRAKIAAAISSQCSACNYAGLYKALVVGFRGDMHSDQRRVLQETGTAHLIAISGLHIGLVAGLFYLLGRFAWQFGLHRLGINRIECSAIIALLAATLYAALAGFSLPTVRALVMLAVIVTALLFRRGVNLLNSIAIAVSLILVFDPLAIGSASFWLSISALLVIALGQYLIQNQTSWLKQLLTIQLLFSIMFMPLSMLLFQQASPAGFLANLVAIPLLSFVVLPLVLFASVLAIIQLSISAWLFQLIDLIMTILFEYLDLLLESGLGVYPGSGVPVLLLLCGAIGLLLILLPLNMKLKQPAFLLVLLPVIWQPESLKRHEYRVTILDVGMGTSAIVETRTHSLIYDFGPGNDKGFSAGDWVVKPYLQFRGISNTDLMVISHVDQDHSGGFVSFVDEIAPGQLLSGTTVEVQQRFKLTTPIRSCHGYPTWQWDGVVFEFLSVDFAEANLSTNNRSCVLLIKGNFSFLLSGDIEADQESKLLARVPEKLKADILLAPHHGSLTSSTKAFVKQVSPRIVAFTIGKNNRWGFPKSEVVKRYQQQESQIFRSDMHGAITLTSHVEAVDIESYRENSRRLWQ